MTMMILVLCVCVCTNRVRFLYALRIMALRQASISGRSGAEAAVAMPIYSEFDPDSSSVIFFFVHLYIYFIYTIDFSFGCFVRRFHFYWALSISSLCLMHKTHFRNISHKCSVNFSHHFFFLLLRFFFLFFTRRLSLVYCYIGDASCGYYHYSIWNVMRSAFSVIYIQQEIILLQQRIEKRITVKWEIWSTSDELNNQEYCVEIVP